jgi:2-keto-3-deoxy-L-rhamnonate aldolase RhmA
VRPYADAARAEEQHPVHVRELLGLGVERVLVSEIEHTEELRLEVREQYYTPSAAKPA